jgi:hypothetical protein
VLSSLDTSDGANTTRLGAVRLKAGRLATVGDSARLAHVSLVEQGYLTF